MDSKRGPSTSASWDHLLEDDFNFDDLQIPPPTNRKESPAAPAPKEPEFNWELDWERLLEDDSDFDGMSFRRINEIPKECLVLIFKEFGFTLPELIKLRHVCYLWWALIQEHIFSLRKSLKLFGGTRESVEKHCSNLIKFDLIGDQWRHLQLKPIHQGDDDLIIPGRYMNISLFTQLSQLFPNVLQLLVYTIKPTFFENLPRLINTFSKCTTLSFFVAYRQDHQFILSQIIHAANARTTLNRLDLFMDVQHYYVNRREKLYDFVLERFAQMNLIRRAEQNFLFNFGAYYDYSYYEKFFASLSSTDSNTWTNISTFAFTPYKDQNSTAKAYCNQITKSYPNLENITEFHIGTIDSVAGDVKMIELIAKQFTSLKCLSMRFECYAETEEQDAELRKLDANLIGALAPLKQLKELTLDNIEVDDNEIKRIMTERNERNAIIPLPSVTNLYLGVNAIVQYYANPVDAKVVCQFLAIAFPNLEQLTIRSDFTEYPFSLEQFKQFLDAFPHLRQHRLYDSFCKTRTQTLYNYHCFDLETFGRHKNWFREFATRKYQNGKIRRFYNRRADDDDDDDEEDSDSEFDEENEEGDYYDDEYDYNDFYVGYLGNLFGYGHYY